MVRLSLGAALVLTVAFAGGCRHTAQRPANFCPAPCPVAAPACPTGCPTPGAPAVPPPPPPGVPVS